MGLDVERTGDVLVATWRDGENRINLDSLGQLEALCEQVERTEGPLGVVVAGEGKFFSNGLDLDRFANDAAQFARTVACFQVLLGRLMVLPAYSVAAVNGHAYAGGAMLTCGFDHRVMREDRGYWCLNEAEIGLPLSEPMAACVMGRLPKATALEAMLIARRFSGPEARDAGIVEELAAQDDVLSRAVERAALGASKDRGVVVAHKRLAFAGIAATCGWKSD